MSNRWPLLALTAAINLSMSATAQTADERKVLSKSATISNLQRLSVDFQNEFERQEIDVQQYLADNPGQLRTFSKAGSVYYLSRMDADGQPVYINTKTVPDTSKNKASGQLIKADTLYQGGSIGVNINGQNMVAGVWDGGLVRETHELLAGKVANQAGQANQGTPPPSGFDDHMAHVSGTMVGKDLSAQAGASTSAIAARGIAFGATSRNYDFANDKAEMIPFAAAGFLISNHSYGDSNDATTPTWRFGAYNSEAKAWDVITKNAPNYLPFVAGGNEQQSSGNRAAKLGYDIMTGSSAAKNVMTVGAIDGTKAMSDYSNWGPTDDGRVKPDLVTKGTGINSAQGTSDTAYSGIPDSSSGTSYASPAAAASGLLLQQYYKTLNPAYMLSSTLKALMMGTTEDLGQPGPDHKFGWGLLNVEAAANAIKKNGAVGSIAGSRGAAILERTTNPVNNATGEESFSIFAKGGVPLVVNMAWLDDDGPEQFSTDGVDPTASRLVYDFDMKVRNVATSADVWPWKIPSMANRTADATVSTSWFDDNRNNFKQIIIAAPAVDAQYTVFIRKGANSPAEVRTVSFVITGLKETAAGPSVLNIDGSDAASRYTAATDGVLIMRYLLGFRGSELTSGALGGSPTRDATAIATYLGGLGTQLDVDGDGQVYAFTDGLLILRRMLGLSGATLTTGAKLGPRSDADIANAIDLLKP